jgi:transcriptional regulator with XRE-family HTH domain
MDAFLKQIEEIKREPEYLAEELVLELTSRICQVMQEQKVSRAELARRLGTSRAFVTSFLNGRPNMTIATLARVATALKVRPAIRFVPWEPAEPKPAQAWSFQRLDWGGVPDRTATLLFSPQKEAKVHYAPAEAQSLAVAA